MPQTWFNLNHLDLLFCESLKVERKVASVCILNSCDDYLRGSSISGSFGTIKNLPEIPTTSPKYCTDGFKRDPPETPILSQIIVQMDLRDSQLGAPFSSETRQKNSV